MSSRGGSKPEADPEKTAAPTDASSYVSGDIEADAGLEDDYEKSHPLSSHDDLDRNEAEWQDRGHMHDLESQKSQVRNFHPLQDRSNKHRLNQSKPVHVVTPDAIQQVPTSGTTGSRLSRIKTTLTNRLAREKLERERLPLTDLSAGLIGWDSQDDPTMPLNFGQNKKWLLLGLISAITFISPLASSMFAPAVSFMDKDFHNDNTIISALTVSIYVLGYVVGPLFLSPLSEIYGRRPVLGCANAMFCVWQIGCALAPNITGLIVMRFLAGIGGSGCLTIGGGVIADLFHREQRGLATSIYSVGPLMGPVIGPICGGFLAERAGWRWDILGPLHSLDHHLSRH